MLAKLENFKTSFSSKSSGFKDDNQGGKEELSDWMSTQLKFAREVAKVFFTYLVLLVFVISTFFKLTCEPCILVLFHCCSAF